MLVGQIITMLTIAISLIVTYIILKTKNIKVPDIAYKIISGVLAVTFFFRYMLGDDAIKQVYKLTNSPISSEFLTAISLILNWLLYSVILLVVLYPFFKNSKYATVIKYYGTIVTLLSVGFINYITIGIVGVEAYSSFNMRTLLMGVELGILLAYCFATFMDNGMFKVNKTDAWGFVYIIGFILAITPAYIPKAFLGDLNPLIEITDLSLWHRIFIYFAFIFPVIIYLFLRKKSVVDKRFWLLYISLAGLIIFVSSYRFESWTHPGSLPIHLCHTAMYIVPLCLIFNWKKLFYFTFFINVLGAFLAMVMPNATGNVTSYGVMLFWSNHYLAFFMPLLLVALKIFERPKLKEFIYSAVAFSVYFLLIAIINAWFYNYDTGVDFFFINSDFIAEKLGKWAENLRNIKWEFPIGKLEFTLYPLYQFLYWLVYIIASAGMWFLYELSYNYFDLMKDMGERRKKYKLDELALQSQLNGRNKEEPLYMENTNKMILENFTKIYGKSNVYAVKDANLEIVGGEIFGFLGPNGAGKSTIIKSIVGIQPITSGSIQICGYDVNKQSVMAKQQIGFVPDHYALYEKLSGREYINYIADLYNVSNEDRNKRIDKYVKLFELETAFDNQMKTYSHGMKQKIAIMAALVHNPKVWILDEPLTGLDPNSIFQVKECMKAHAKSGNIVFFSSHIIDVVEKICDRIGIIKKGQIQCVKTIKEIEESGTTLEDFYMNIIQKNKVNAIPVKRAKDQQDKDKKTKLKEKKLLMKAQQKEIEQKKKEICREQKQQTKKRKNAVKALKTKKSKRG